MLFFELRIVMKALRSLLKALAENSCHRCDKARQVISTFHCAIDMWRLKFMSPSFGCPRAIASYTTDGPLVRRWGVYLTGCPCQGQAVNQEFGDRDVAESERRTVQGICPSPRGLRGGGWR